MLTAAVLCLSAAFVVYAEPTETDQEDEQISTVLIGDTESEGSVSMNFSYGYRDIAKCGHKLPFSVHIDNSYSKDIDARLVIEAEGSVETGIDTFEAAVNRYSFDVHIPADGEASVDNVISIAEENPGLNIRLYEGEEVLAELNENIRINSAGSELLIGILSDSPEKLEYFNGVSVAQTALRARTIELDPATLPKNALELEQLDMIIISDFSIARTDAEHIAAIEEWTENGGVLLIGSGLNPQAAMSFGAYRDNFEINERGKQAIDMGMQYSKNGPDGAVLKLNVCDISMTDGIRVMQASDMAALTVVNGTNGTIGFTAYDLCDISDFCQQEMSFTDDLLTDMLGFSRIERMLNSSSSSREVYEKTGDFMGVTSPESMPGTGIYITFACFYLVFIAAFLYFGLRNRGLEIYYQIFVVISAFVGAFAVWMMGAGIRYDGLSLDYAAVREIQADSVSESGYIRLFSAASDSYELGIPENYEIYPIVRSAEDDNSLLKISSAKASEKESKLIEYIFGKEGKTVRAGGLGPFAGTMLEFSTSEESIDKNGSINAKLHFYDEKFNGSIVNNSKYDIEDAALLVYGKIAKIGRIKAGESIDVSQLEALCTPISDSYSIAAYVTGLKESDNNISDYADALKKTRFLSNYIQASLESYYKGIRLIGFSVGENIFKDITADKHADVSGTLLKSVNTDASFAVGKNVWRTALSSDPAAVTGEYDTASNTSRGSVVIEYNLGNDVNVRELYFTALSEEFEGSELSAFTGKMSLYNYITGSYDEFDEAARFGEVEIAPYLSPANTLMVRFMPEESAIGTNGAFLPVPNIIGEEK